jgi:basic amino acid/polyamine antiporter, APA family
VSQSNLSLSTGVGLVIANMVGAGVFLSTGFMAQSMPPATILWAWALGALLALCGAVAYAEAARLVPGAGGEYRYVSALIHPALGTVAGWASLLLGFSAPLALDAVAAGAFARAVFPALNPQWVALGLLALITTFHALGFQSSERFQNVLVLVKVSLLLGFVAVCTTYGTLNFPTWTPPSPAEDPFSNFASSLFFVAFAFSGWNASVYAADEFKNPVVDVKRSMLLGAGAVALFYLAVNFLFVANLSPSDGQVVFQYDNFAALQSEASQATLGQAIVARLVGSGASRAMSAVMFLVFVSAMSAFTLLGPRVYAAMAAQGALPKVFASKDGRHPPASSTLLQAALACALIFLSDLRSMLSSVGALLVFFSALTVLGVLVTKFKNQQPVKNSAALAAAVYLFASVSMLVIGSRLNPKLPLFLLGIIAVSTVAWAIQRPKAAENSQTP